MTLRGLKRKADPKPQDILWLDTETFSDIPLKRGHHAYFHGKDAQIMVAAWAWNDDPVTVEDLTSVDANGQVHVRMCSDDLLEAIYDADLIVIHNSPFDRTGIKKLWDIDIPVERVHDTMAQAMAHSLPGALGKLCEIMRVPTDQAKDAEGKKLIDLFCKYAPKNWKQRRAHKKSHPEEWAKFLSYAGHDITAMRALKKLLPSWNYRNANGHRELDLWRIDQRSNDAGFRIDMRLTDNAIATIAREQRLLSAEAHRLTGGDVEKASQRDAMLAHIFTEYGIYLPDMKKDTLERRLQDDEIPDALKQLIRVRLAATTTSTAKYAAVKRSAVEESPGVHVLRGTTAFCGALRTGRWAGRIFQPQNLPRPDMTPEDILAAIEALQADGLDLVSSHVMKALSNILRGLIIARPGMKLVCADLEQIESRVAAWLAGEQWKLDTVAEYDAGEGYDNYVWAYANAFGVTPEAVIENKKRNGFWRQVGKVMELACGYEGGVGAWLAFAMVYRLNLEQLAAEAYPNLPHKAREQAEIMWDWRHKKGLTVFGLGRKTFVVIEAFKSLWRAAHPAISGYWPELNEAAMEAIRYPGHEVAARQIVFEKKGAWLRMIMPSGRIGCYPVARIRVVGGKDQIVYVGVNQYSRKWSEIATYGGKIFENATQFLARDVMAYNIPEIVDAGYNLLATVHDEAITEAPDNDNFTSENLCAILATNPPWLKGCPLAAGGFEADRYRKD